MIPLQVHITAGPQAGTRLQIAQSPVTFGRAPDNTLVLDLATASRYHGELRYQDNAWWLANLSKNSTRVDRKRVTPKKPRALGQSASVSIGDAEVFRVSYEAQPPAEPTPGSGVQPDTQAPPQQEAAPGTGLRKRSRLWLLLGLWFALCIGLFIVGLTTFKEGNPDSTGPGNSLTRYPTAQDVRDILKRTVTRETPDDYLYSINIERAREAEVSRPRDRFLHEAYSKYREALRYLPASQRLAPEDSQRYDIVLDELSVLIYERFDRAHTLYGQTLYADAITEIDLLRELFPANPNEDEVADHLMQLRGQAAARLRR